MKIKKPKFKFLKSIRFRITILLFVMGIVPSIVVETVIVQSYESRAVSQRTVIVKNQCDLLADQLVSSGYMSDPTNDVIDGKMDMLTSIYGGRVLIVNKDYKVIKDSFRLDSGKYLITPAIIEAFEGTEQSQYDRNNQYIQMTVTVKDSETQEIQGVMLISVSTTEIRTSKNILETRGVMILGIVILLTLVLGYLFSSLLMRPFQKITTAIDALNDSLQYEKIDVQDYQETELITNAFNRMIDQVQAVDDSRSEFVSNVSHELKTPLASMKVLSDALNMNPDAPVEQYREFMVDISSEIDRETSIINDLLSLVKMDKKAENLHIAPTDINELLAQIIKRLKPIGDRQNVELILDSFRPVTAEIDETKLTLAFSNIIENAIKYNKPEGGWVRISLNADKKYCYVTIGDSGIGIPEDQIDHVFERFYRVDKSHSREIGGTGLGLAITKSAIAMHKGAVRVTSTVGEGTTFSIRIPLVYVV